MGSGKSTISKSLCDLFSLDLIDTDAFIEKEENKSIKEIFDNYGEPYFREKEYEMALKLKVVQNAVISTGGGMILNERNTQILSEIGRIIYLRGSTETLYRNLISQVENRPLLENEELKNKIDTLLLNRSDLYEAAADYVVDIDSKDVNQISTEIYKLLTAI